MNVGGPATGFRLLMDSELAKDFTFVPLLQKEGRQGFSFAILKDLIRQIRMVNPDLVHVRGLHSEGFYGVLAARMAGCRKVVLSIHGTYTDSLNIGRVKRAIFKWIIEPITMKLASVAYCVCSYAAHRPYIYKNVRHLYGYIHNAAPDFSSLVPLKERRRIRESLGVGPDDVVVIVVARITLGKGFKEIAEAYRHVSHECDFRLLVLGEGDYLSTLTNDLSDGIRRRRVIMLGRQSDVPSYLFASDIFILPTLHENLSNALLEACEAGLAIVTTEVGGNPEIITHGETGLLIPPRNAEQLAGAVKLLIQDIGLRRRLGNNARSSVRTKFNQKRIFSQLKAMYTTLLEKPR